MKHHDPKKILKAALDIALLKKDAMHHVASDKNMTRCAYVIIAASALLLMIGQLTLGVKIPFLGVMRPSLMAALGQAIISVISAVAGLYLVSFVAKSIFKGSAHHDAFFRVAAFGMIVGFLRLIPALSIISAIWGIVIFFVVLKEVHKLTTGGVIGTFFVSLIAGFILSLVLAPIYAMLGLGFGAGGSGSYNMNGNFMKGNPANFGIDIPGEDGGSVKFDGSSMKITGEDGETIEINIPIDLN